MVGLRGIERTLHTKTVGYIVSVHLFLFFLLIGFLATVAGLQPGGARRGMNMHRDTSLRTS